MPGKSKYAEKMAKHLNEQIDAACSITRPGGTVGQVATGVGGVAGAAIAGIGNKNRDSDIQVGNFAWLGVGTDHFAITKSSMMGKPTGEPIARVAYADVTDFTLTETKLTLRVDLDLSDGRHVAFESKRHGQNKPSVEVLELLQQRCTR